MKRRLTYREEGTTGRREAGIKERRETGWYGGSKTQRKRKR